MEPRVIPSHDLECGKSTIAANNQRQSQQQHAVSQRGIRRHIPAGMTEEGPGAGPGVQKKHAPICFGFSSSLQSHHTPLGFRVKPLGAASGWHGREPGRGEPQLGTVLPCCQRAPAGTGVEGSSAFPSHTSAALPATGIWATGTRLHRPRVAVVFWHQLPPGWR